MSRFEKIISRFKFQNIFVIGDIMVDEYIWGDVERISPEAPVPVVEVKKQEIILGGAGNVIKNLVALGGKVTAASVVGNENYGNLILETLKSFKVNTKCVFIDESRITTKKTRILAAHQQVLRVDKETRNPISYEFQKKILKFYKKNIEEFSCILVSDYLKGVVTDEISQEIIYLANKKNKIIVIDPKGYDFSKYRYATVLTPNKSEAEIASKIKIKDDNSIIQSGSVLIDELDLKAILITRGEEGMTFIEDSGEAYHIPAYAKEVFDVTGAGDTVLSTFGLSLSSGASYFEAAQIANLAASIVVGKVGTAVVSKEELLKEFSNNNYLRNIFI